MAGISDLPMLHDIDADYSPQYVKLARILRDKIESGQYRRGDSLPAAELASQYTVSVRVTCNAVRELRRAAAGGLRLPGMRSPPPEVEHVTGRPRAAIRRRRSSCRADLHAKRGEV